MTHSDGCSLSYKSDQIKPQLPMRGKSNARRNHKDNDGEFLVWIIESECPLDQKDCNRCKGLSRRGVSVHCHSSIEQQTFNICIYETLR